MGNYYESKLSAGKLFRVYEVGNERANQYFEAEIQEIMKHIKPADEVLELGCGYGRITRRMAEVAKKTVGLDYSQENLDYAVEYNKDIKNMEFVQGDAGETSFKDEQFDLTVIAQNGISAFKVPPVKLMREALRITKPGGCVLFSSYAARFWDDRMVWFKAQADAGLLGEIDWDQTKDGVIVCKDGFKAITFTADDFLDLCNEVGVLGKVYEIDGSSLFCEIIKE